MNEKLYVVIERISVAESALNGLAFKIIAIYDSKPKAEECKATLRKSGYKDIDIEEKEMNNFDLKQIYRVRYKKCSQQMNCNVFDNLDISDPDIGILKNDSEEIIVISEISMWDAIEKVKEILGAKNV